MYIYLFTETTFRVWTGDKVQIFQISAVKVYFILYYKGRKYFCTDVCGRRLFLLGKIPFSGSKKVKGPSIE